MGYTSNTIIVLNLWFSMRMRYHTEPRHLALWKSRTYCFPLQITIFSTTAAHAKRTWDMRGSLRVEMIDFHTIIQSNGFSHLQYTVWMSSCAIRLPVPNRFRETWETFKARFSLNTLRPRNNGRHFADDIFKCIFLNENVWIPINIYWSSQGSN